jgi:DNA-directed RNA polymerase subunit RPC12/RpoP
VSEKGFFFGATPMPANGSASDSDDGIAEVSGEPISRNEAKTLGVFDLNQQSSLMERGSRTTRVRRKSASGRHAAFAAPEGVSPETVRKVEEARDLLSEGEIEKALTLAQEAVWEQPSFVAAKVVIARAFIANNENSKALALLQAIPDQEMIAEAVYYQGIALNNIGRGPEALEAFKKSLARASSDADLRKHATDMISRMRGEYIACPICGRKVLPDAIVDIGEESVCSDCARKLEEEEPDDDEFDATGLRRRRKLRPPKSKTDILLRIVIGILALFIILFALYYAAPDYYMKFRSLLPESWSFPPRTGFLALPPPSSGTGAGLMDNTPKVLPSFVITSEAMKNPMVGVPFTHQVQSIGMNSPSYQFEISPGPAEAPEFDPMTGVFTWTPGSDDEGKKFQIVFRGIHGTSLSMDQENTVAVLSRPAVKTTNASSAAEIGDLCRLLAADVDGDGKTELTAISGDYWTGRIKVFALETDGTLRERWQSEFSGRPVGAGIVSARGETWLAIADYWNSRIRFFAIRNNALSEVALSIILPGRPIMADVDPETSIIAALCLSDSGFQAVAYRQVDQLASEHLGTWPIPDNSLWRNLHILKANTGSQSGSTPGQAVKAPPQSARLALVRGGARPLYYLDSSDGGTWRESGTTVATVLDSIRTENDDGVLLLTSGLNRKAAAVRIDPATSQERRYELDGLPEPVSSGMVLFDANADGKRDLAVITSEAIAVYFEQDDGPGKKPVLAPMTGRARLFGSSAAFRQEASEPAEMMFFLTADGAIQSLSLGE